MIDGRLYWLSVLAVYSCMCTVVKSDVVPTHYKDQQRGLTLDA